MPICIVLAVSAAAARRVSARAVTDRSDDDEALLHRVQDAVTADPCRLYAVEATGEPFADLLRTDAD
jgi:hypothetical protein